MYLTELKSGFIALSNEPMSDAYSVSVPDDFEFRDNVRYEIDQENSTYREIEIPIIETETESENDVTDSIIDVLNGI